jgi:hypothetical protein
VPGRLRRFDPEGWPGETIWERHEAWLEAREDHRTEHGDWLEDLTELVASFELVPDEPFDPDAI